MRRAYDVIIAGAGPVGLFVACELGLAGVSTLVLERDAAAASPAKALPLGLRGLNTVAVEALYRRGLLDGVFHPSEPRPATIEKTPERQHAGHVAGIFLDGNKLTMSDWKYRLPGPSLLPGPTDLARVEGALEKRARELGVTIRRGAGVTAVEQDGEGVTVTVGSASLRAPWLVGCDGGRSTVRKAAGFELAGTDPLFTGYVMHCDLDDPTRLPPGFHPTPQGMFIVGPGGQIYLMDFDGGAFDRAKPLERAYLESVLRRLSGVDVRIVALHAASSFTDRSKHATTYRKGRVLLAGDSAHIHSPVGSQGLNTGLGDAINLGWKLAAVIDGTSPAALLDTYTQERHPIAAAVLEWSRAQVIALKPDLHGQAVYKVLRDLTRTNEGTSYFVDRIWGLSQRYDLGDAHPLVGMSAPDFELEGGTRLGERLHGGRGLLIDFTDGAALASLARRWAPRVEHVSTRVKDTLGLRALLVRPDGAVAWVAEGEPDLDTAASALSRWFGAAGAPGPA